MLLANRPRPAWVLAGYGAALMLVTGLWIRVDHSLLSTSDTIYHHGLAQLYARALSVGGPEGLWQTLRASPVEWPPASFLFYGVLGALGGEQAQALRMWGVLFIPLMLAGVYLLGRPLVGRRAATLAAVLAVLSFGVTAMIRYVSMDLPSAVVVLWANLALTRARRLDRPGPAALLGLAWGLCLLTRVQASFFVAGPAMAVALHALWRAPAWAARLRVLLHLGLAAGVAAAVSSPWWYGHLEIIWGASTAHLDPNEIAPRGNPGLLYGLAYYPRELATEAGLAVAACAAAAGVMLGVRTWRRRPSPAAWRPVWLVLLPWILGGVVGCAVGVHREARYILPAVPAVALLAALALTRLPRRFFGVAGAAVLLATAVPSLGLAGIAHSQLLGFWLPLNPLAIRPPHPPLPSAPILRRGLARVLENDPRGDRTYIYFTGVEHLEAVSLVVGNIPGARLANPTPSAWLPPSARQKQARQR